MTNEELDRMIGQLAVSYNEPPAVPHEAMWAAIDRNRHVTSIVAARRTPRWLYTAVGVAAVLMVGVAIGRLSRGPAAPITATAKEEPVAPTAPGAQLATTPEASAEPAARKVATAMQVATVTHPAERTTHVCNASVDASADAATYRLAVMQHLTRTELLLTSFQSDARTNAAKVDAQFGGAARDLLGTTRLMLATHRNDDPTMTRLLEDLELVLMQISQYATDGRVIDRDAAAQSIDKRNVLTKLRATIPAGT